MSLGKYEYKCPDCNRRIRSDQRGNTLMPRQHCQCGFPGPFKRVFGFSMAPVMQEHFNSAVGAPISSMRQFKDELKRKSEIATAETGIEHRFAPLDYGDHDAFGATNEGIDESNRAREKLGMPLLPEIK